MNKMLFIFAMSVLVLVLFSCSQLNLFEPKSKISVIFSSAVEGEGDVTKVQEYSSYSSTVLQGLNKREEAPWIKDIQHLYVKVSKFSYKYSTGPGAGKWATPTTVEKVIDFTALDSETEWLKFDVPKGAVIVALALEVTQATVTINDQSYPVTIPAEKARVVLPNLNWEVKDDSSEIVLSIDWSRSIIKSGPTSYMLVPRVAYRWRGTLKYLWAIYGDIKVNEATPTEPLLIGLFEGTDTSATPTVLKLIPLRNEGKFWLGKHEKGIYTIVVWDNLTWEFEDEKYVISARKATETTFEHGKETAHTELHLAYSK
ncbi:DUF4382 domain-containing protein [Fervidobacterium islandicum]|uniref:DUF4382 domain-containing protein n=1 Tax=Fervidobacterium islandicum TaxID=2423 RepID=A0AAI8CLD2_FERIS|nr:DUF4382 domain-containing protein [Fervidobacterium islandicum]AMW32512.1 DUF4382 domain-containing protein [Fervidobacterium islandicum]